MQIQISKNNDNLVTFSQPVNVHENNTDEDAPKSENESTILQDVKAATAAANEAAESANDAAEEAESKAQAADQAAQGANEASQQIQQNAAAGNYSASVSVGTVATGDPGTQAQIYNSGTKKDAIFNFIIPQGPQGDTGLQGPEGPQGPMGEVDANTQIVFTQAASRENIASGEKLNIILGKIRKWFADIKGAAFQDVSNTLTTTEAGKVLDARQGKVLDEKIENLSGEVSDLNSKLYEKIYKEDALSIADFYDVTDFDLRKRGNEVFFNVSLSIQSGTQFDPNTLYSIGPSPMLSEKRKKKIYFLNGYGCDSNWGNPTPVSIFVDTSGHVQYCASERKAYFKISGHWFID